MTVVDNLPPDWDGYVRQAVADYSAAAAVELELAGPQPCVSNLDADSFPQLHPELLDRNSVCLDLHPLGWLSGTEFWGYTFIQPHNWTQANGSLIAGVEIYLDAARIADDPGWLQWIVCHELGHALGLGHRPSGDDSCMVNGSGVQHPDAADLAVIDTQTTVYVCQGGCPAAPQNTRPPKVSGQARVGAKLKGSRGTWTGKPKPTYRYQWQRCSADGTSCAEIAGAVARAYKVGAGDVGSDLRLVVSAENMVGPASASSPLVAAVG